MKFSLWPTKSNSESGAPSQRPRILERAWQGFSEMWRAQRGTLFVACLAAGVLAQYLLDKGGRYKTAAVLYALAMVCFVILFRRQPTENVEDAADAGRLLLSRWWLVVIAWALGVVAFPRFTGNLFHRDATLLWMGGLVLLGLAAWAPAPRRAEDMMSERAPDRRGLVLTWEHIALLSIMGLGAFYRFYKLDLIPAEMGCDLPHNYNNIRMILRSEFPIFFSSYPGREALFFYWAAPIAKLFGLSHLTIKAASALIGVLTLPAVYLLGKELYHREAGLYAAFFMSISHWHIILTRVGYRASMVPFMICGVWYFLIRGLKTGRRWFYALSGLFLGLGLYTYNAFMIAPVMVVAMLLVCLIAGRGRTLWANRDNIVLLVLVAMYVFIPLARYAYEQPETYGYRAATRITGVETDLPQDLVGTFFMNTRNALLMFNVKGDAAFIANVPYLRQMGFFPAVLFALGMAYLLWRWRCGYNATVLASLGVMLLPTILSLAFPHEVPNAIRAIGAIPAAMIAPAAALMALRRGATALYPAQPAREMALIWAENGASRFAWRWRWTWSPQYTWAAALIAAAVIEVRAVYPVYFRDYVKHLPDENYSITLNMARAIDDFADDGAAYIKIMPYWYDGNAVRAQLRRADQSWSNELDALRPGEPPLAGPPGKFMVIVHPDDQQTLAALRSAFPKGIELQNLNDKGGIAFITFYGER